MSNVRDSGVNRGGERGRTDGLSSPASLDREKFGKEYIYPSKMDCIKTLLERMDKYASTRDKEYNENVNYTGDFNSWFMSTGYMYGAHTTKNWAQNGYRGAHFESKRTLRWNTREGLVEISVHGGDQSMRSATNKGCHNVFKEIRDLVPRVQIDEITYSTESNQDEWLHLDEKIQWVQFMNKQIRKSNRYYQYPRVQMDEKLKEGEQGMVNQESDKQVNTIITRDQQETKSDHAKALDNVDSVSSSEPVHQFPTITQRWMPLDSISIKTTDGMGDLIKTYYLPENLYQDVCSPNLMPFESFIYGRLDVEIRIVVNANKFSCGKLLMSSKYDSYQADLVQSGYQSALARNHVIIDLCANNEGVLQVPFRYHRPYMRLVKNDNMSIGVRPSKYASIYLHILSPLQTGKDGTTNVDARLFFRVKDSKYTGMSYRVKVQGFGLEDIITPTTSRALREVLVGAEKAFDQLGRSRNQDKPGQIQAINVVPQPRLNFSGGKGLGDVIPLRVNPHTLTNYRGIVCPDDEPKSFYDLARIWGVVKSVEWSATVKEGAELLDMIIDPTSRSYTEDKNGTMTPLEYACGNYAFWSGPIELRIDFVSNSFHTGSIQLSAEFGRTSGSKTECESSSTYTKVFHLGEQKSVSFRVPYIYDTVMRRTTANIVNPYESVASTAAIQGKALTVAPESKTRFKIRVLNALRPVTTAPQAIQCLVFMRAGKSFHMHGLKGFSYIPDFSIKVIDQFPYDYPVTVPNVRTRRSAEPAPAEQTAWEKQNEQRVKDKALPQKVRNQWNEYKPEELPRTQMDNGEKEDQDETDNFSQGINSSPHITMDNQLLFKDLLRRPTLIMHQVKVPANVDNNSAFFIPLQPPSRQLSIRVDGKDFTQNGKWATTLGYTSTVAIMDMFRCWRGSMRYTIVTHEGLKPYYVSLVPHTGVRLMGNHEIVAKQTNAYPMMGFNFTTTMVVPSVNPTITVEAPYETENTWSLTFDDDANLNYSWRDKGDYNSGHLMISTATELTVDIWWSAGDDFEIANFYGIPHTHWNGWAYRLNDTHARVQMDSDFSLSESVTKVTGFLKSGLKPGVLVRAAVGAVPFVGTPLVMADAVTTATSVMTTVTERVDETARNGNIVLAKLARTIDSADTHLETISDLIKRSVEQITGTFKGLMGGIDLLYNLLLDIIIAWMEKSWTVIGIAMVRFFGKFLGGQLDIIGTLMTYAEQISEYIRTTVVNGAPRVQADTDNTSIYIGILAGLVGTIMGVRLNPSDWNGSWVRNIGLRLTSATGVAYLVHVLNFVKGTFSTMKDMIMKALGYISPEAAALKKLSESSEKIDHFVREAQIMTSESNGSLINQPQFRRRFWYTVLQAHQIQRMLCAISTNVVSYQLSKLCSDVIKMGNEKFLDLSASPVRFEPMVICLEGPSGVGKSHVTEELVDRLLKAVNITPRTSEKIFYRTSGERFWSGYRDQPVVVYDEWLNTTDSMRCTDQIAEMMKLKSTAIFVPEMAHLEEKKIRGNPLLIIVCCNDAFPNALADYATCPRATLRRRDLVLHVTRKDEFADVDPKYCTEEQRSMFQRYEHLKFQAYKSVDDPKSRSHIWKDFDVTSHWVEESWKRYFKHQTEQVKVRMQRLPEYMSQIENNNLTDPFTIFYQLNTKIESDRSIPSNGYTHYEALETALQLTLNAVQTPIVEEEIEITPPIPWELAQATTQSGNDIIGGLCAGLAVVMKIPKWIAKSSNHQLKQWEEQILPMKTQDYDCSICLERTPCAYVCQETLNGAALHTVCAPCFLSLNQYGNGKCPMCRCENMVPLLGREDVSSLSVWMQLVLRGVYSLSWLCEKIIAYYRWRDDHFGLSILTEVIFTHLLSLSNAHRGFGVNAGFALGRYIRAGMFIWNRWDDIAPLFSVVQSDEEDWGSWVEPRVQVQVGSDQFLPQVDEQVIDEWILKPMPSKLCLHGKLKQHIATAELESEHWKIMDEVTRRVLLVPVHVCEANCVIMDNEEPQQAYRQIVDHWLALHRNTIRNMYITYYNEPTEHNMLRIQPVLRATWMINEVEPIPLSWWEWLSSTWDQYRDMLIYTGAALGVIAAMIGAYNLATRLTTITTAASQISATAGSPERSPRNPRRLITRSGQAQRAYFHAEQDTPTIYEVVTGYICRNTFQLQINVGTKKKIMYGTGLFNHCLLIPRHYVRELKEAALKGCRITGFPLASPQLEAEIVITNTILVESDDTDLAYIILPPKFPIFKDIRKYLATDKDFEHPITSEGILLANPKSGTLFMREIEVDIHGIEKSQVVIDNNDQSFVVKDVLKYSYSKAGVCGSLLLRENHQRPILSMHFAGIGEGISGYGFGIILTQEALGSLITNRAVPTQFDDVHYESIEQAKFIYPDNIHLHYYGSLTPDKVPYIPSKSKLVKSEIFGAEGLETNIEPAILDKSDPRYIHPNTPLYYGVEKHGKITKDFTAEQVDRAGEAYWDLWLSKMKPLVASPKVLTDSEAVVGLDIDHYVGVDLSTSAGYPYNLNKQRTTKRDYITVRVDEQLKPIEVESWDPQLRKILEEKRQLRKQGIVPHTLFVDTLKDEKRPHEKVMKPGGTRVFCSSPVDYVIECRKYFLHFVAAFMDQRMELMHAVGINPTSCEWTWLTDRLLCKNSKLCTIDYANFGPGYNAMVAKKAYELMVRWVRQWVKEQNGDDIDERVLNCIVYECLQSMHVCNNTVYQQGGGSPSGAFFTTPINTMVNVLYLLIAWDALISEIMRLQIEKKGSIVKREDTLKLVFNLFKDNVELFCYGDDGVFSVKEEYLEVYNMQTITSFFKDYGIVATDAAKSGMSKKYEELSEAQFLKRGFLMHPTRANQWLSPLKWESVVSCTQWIWKAENRKDATRVNALAAIMEAYTHGPIVFQKFKNVVNRALLKARIEPVTGSWEEFDKMFYTTGFEFNIDEFILKN